MAIRPFAVPITRRRGPLSPRKGGEFAAAVATAAANAEGYRRPLFISSNANMFLLLLLLIFVEVVFAVVVVAADAANARQLAARRLRWLRWAKSGCGGGRPSCKGTGPTAGPLLLLLTKLEGCVESAAVRREATPPAVARTAGREQNRNGKRSPSVAATADCRTTAIRRGREWEGRRGHRQIGSINATKVTAGVGCVKDRRRRPSAVRTAILRVRRRGRKKLLLLLVVVRSAAPDACGGGRSGENVTAGASASADKVARPLLRINRSVEGNCVARL